MKMDKSPEQLYKERIKRVEDATQLKVPDRVPIMATPHFFPTNIAGVSCEDAMYDYDKLETAWEKYLLDFQPDTYPNPYHRIALGPLMESLDSRQFRWPGHGVSPDHTYQFVEEEHLKANDYDAFLFDPSDYILRTYLPRICGALEPLRMLPHYGEFGYSRVITGASAFGIPEVAQAIEILIKTGSEAQNMLSRARSFTSKMTTLGFPTDFSMTCNAPFDYIGNCFRGTRGIMLDMYRYPDKLLDAIDKVLPMIANSSIYAAKKSGNPRIFIPLHKGADAFMSLEQFKTFYWPSLQKLAMSFIDEGLTPCLFFEGQYISRLEIIGDIPAGKAIYWFEHTDLFTVKKALGSRVCIKGNVPASMLCTGSPQEVKDYCKKLIDVVGKGGGFILDGANGIPDEARVENVKAMIDFTKEYGVYR